MKPAEGKKGRGAKAQEKLIGREDYAYVGASMGKNYLHLLARTKGRGYEYFYDFNNNVPLPLDGPRFYISTTNGEAREELAHLAIKHHLMGFKIADDKLFKAISIDPLAETQTPNEPGWIKDAAGKTAMFYYTKNNSEGGEIKWEQVITEATEIIKEHEGPVVSHATSNQQKADTIPPELVKVAPGIYCYCSPDSTLTGEKNLPEVLERMQSAVPRKFKDDLKGGAPEIEDSEAKLDRIAAVSFLGLKKQLGQLPSNDEVFEDSGSEAELHPAGSVPKPKPPVPKAPKPKPAPQPETKETYVKEEFGAVGEYTRLLMDGYIVFFHDNKIAKMAPRALEDSIKTLKDQIDRQEEDGWKFHVSLKDYGALEKLAQVAAKYHIQCFKMAPKVMFKRRQNEKIPADQNKQAGKVAVFYYEDGPIDWNGFIDEIAPIVAECPGLPVQHDAPVQTVSGEDIPGIFHRYGSDEEGKYVPRAEMTIQGRRRNLPEHRWYNLAGVPELMPILGRPLPKAPESEISEDEIPAPQVTKPRKSKLPWLATGVGGGVLAAGLVATVAGYAMRPHGASTPSSLPAPPPPAPEPPPIVAKAGAITPEDVRANTMHTEIKKLREADSKVGLIFFDEQFCDSPPVYRSFTFKPGTQEGDDRIASACKKVELDAKQVSRMETYIGKLRDKDQDDKIQKIEDRDARSYLYDENNQLVGILIETNSYDFYGQGGKVLGFRREAAKLEEGHAVGYTIQDTLYNTNFRQISVKETNTIHLSPNGDGVLEEEAHTYPANPNLNSKQKKEIEAIRSQDIAPLPFPKPEEQEKSLPPR